MRKFKRALAAILSLMMCIAFIQLPISVQATESTEVSAQATEEVYVKIRYNRPDGNYDDWNLWVWEAGKDGQRVDFIGEDQEGKFAVVKTSKDAGQLGYILRRSEQGNEWAENYFGADKFVDLTAGDTEVIINHKDEDKDVELKEINRDFEKVTLNVHYYRFNNDYDEWDVWAWLDPNHGGEGHAFTGEDDFGKTTSIVYENVVDAREDGIGIIIRKPDWSAKDIEFDRFINLAYANNNGEINAYLVQSNSEIVFTAEDAVKDLAITSAKMDSVNEISFITNVKMSKDLSLENVTLKENGEVIKVKSLEINENLTSGKIVTEKDLSLTNEYNLEIDGYLSKDVTLGKIFNSDEFADLYHYNGELGALYSKEKTSFVLWSPTATSVKLALFDAGNGVDAKEVKEMAKGENGIWTLDVNGDLKGTYYTYLVTNNGVEKEVTDPYAKAVGVNGNRAMVIDLSSTNPEGWENDVKPEFVDATDAIIYELHIRDFTIDESSGASMEVQGKYNGMWESGTTLFGNGDIKTGIDHLVELGITHVHLLPTFDHRSIDETKLDQAQYNWGYDPQNYNVPEGSYSSDPYSAEVRVEEFKKMVMELHKVGIRVVMDVVYNHTGATADSHLNLAVPDYYYRQNSDGGFSNGSGCGNELASERSMVRKMMVDSVKYWAEEYHIDGFRFDLMALHDITTMKEIRTTLNEVDESILVYGEGWTGGDSPLSSEEQALKVNTVKYGDLQIAAFSDDMRDAIKGHVFEDETAGFVNGFDGLEEVIKFGIVASTPNEQVDYTGGPNQYSGYGKTAWANQPYQTINYASAHDNLTLWDKLQTTNSNASEEELLAMNKMSAALVLTSQGIPFFQAGEEMARTKVNEDGSFNHNSYNAPDSVNKMDWTRKEKYNDLFEYYKGLISLRKAHKSFRMNTTADIQAGLNFIDVTDSNVVAYTLDGKQTNDSWDNIAVIFNSNDSEVEVELPSSDWTIVVNGEKAGVESLGTVDGNKVVIPAKASYVLVDTNSYNGTTEDEPSEDVKPETNEKPVINAKDLELTVGDKFDVLSGVTASDKEDGDLTSSIQVIENTVNTKKAGKYKVTYKVTDSDNNETTLTINVTVKAKEMPKTGGQNSFVVLAVALGLVVSGAFVIKGKRRQA
ncbi:type I pullulanase [uncultured Clostridium sp.]|uniref:type I pullulanase n=1 Tax=uncultured Clostridium sp. TaxID=59620 RepID=UPI0025F4B387|nr:type I pullulanase [uncultured Clostridium sp.]